jgi:hypothetical protein
MGGFTAEVMDWQERGGMGVDRSLDAERAHYGGECYTYSCRWG